MRSISGVLSVFILTLIIPPTGQAQPVSTQRQVSIDWHTKHVVEAYEQVGRRDPKWDETARQIVAAAARRWAVDCTPTEDERDITRHLGPRAIEAGCDDPVVLYVTANTLGAFRERLPEAYQWHLAAARVIAESNEKTYHPAIRCFILARAAQWRMRHQDAAAKDEASKLLEQAIAQWPAIASDPEIPRSRFMEVFDIFSQCAQAVDGRREPACSRVFEIIQDKCKDQSLVLTVMARFYVDQGWEARGHGFADTVTQEMWQKLAENLRKGEEAAGKAWELDRSNAEACFQLLRIAENHPEARTMFPTWFERAVAADPSSFKPYKFKLTFLEPKWHGSVEELVGFGRECYDTGRWDDLLPMMLVEAHVQAAYYAGGQLLSRPHPSYFSKDERVWEDIHKVYQEYLKRVPDSVFHRTRYATLAAWCGHWEQAGEQLRWLGDRYSYHWFRNDDAARELRAQVDRNLKK